jgi:hypothetical protein
LDHGGRILHSIVRPYPAKTAGIPLRFEYETTTGEFIFEWVNPGPGSGSGASIEDTAPTVAHPPQTGHPEITSQETEIFIPALITQGRKLVIHGLRPEDSHRHDVAQQTLRVFTPDMTPGKIHKLRISLDPPLHPAFRLNTFWGDFGLRIFAISVVFIGMVVYWSFRLGQ